MNKTQLAELKKNFEESKGKGDAAIKAAGQTFWGAVFEIEVEQAKPVMKRALAAYRLSRKGSGPGNAEYNDFLEVFNQKIRLERAAEKVSDQEQLISEYLNGKES